MRRIHFAIFLIAFVGLVFFGCTDKVQSPTAASSNTLQPLSKTTGPGAWIIKSDGETVWACYDPDTQLMLIIGINDIPSYLAGTGGIDIFNQTDILLPNADANARRDLKRLNSNSAAVLVWYTDIDNPLYLLQNVTPTASGNVNYSYNDNDYYAFRQDNKNHDAFGWKANGTLTGSDGTIYKLNFTDKLVWDGVDLSSTKESLMIQLTPTGK